MKSTALTITLILCSIVQAIERPPAMEPNQVPFAIDTSKVVGDILGYTTIRTGEAYSKIFKVQYSTDPNAPVSLSRAPGIGAITKIARDPNFPTIRRFRFDYQANTEQVVYLNLTATVIAPDGYPVRDNRCWIIKAEQPETPIIFVNNIGRYPMIYTKAGTDPKQIMYDWQRLRKLYGKVPTEAQANEILVNSGLPIPEYVKIP